MAYQYNIGIGTNVGNISNIGISVKVLLINLYYNCSELIKQQFGLFCIVDNINLTCIVTEYLE